MAVGLLAVCWLLRAATTVAGGPPPVAGDTTARGVAPRPPGRAQASCREAVCGSAPSCVWRSTRTSQPHRNAALSHAQPMQGTLIIAFHQPPWSPCLPSLVRATTQARSRARSRARRLGGQQALHLAALAPRVHDALLGQRRLARQQQAHIALKLGRVKRALVPLDRRAAAVHDELLVVPRHLAVARPRGLGARQRGGLRALQVLVQRVRVGPVDQDLVVHVKLEPKLLPRPRALLVVAARRLAAKLVAGERDEVEPVSLVLVVQCPQAGVVDVLQGSFRRHVHDHQHLVLVLGQRALHALHAGAEAVDV
mmetsp:Transcript_37393/g.94349  ORF Transcript_37393/g.94349 Transcript_37393/m.94349 type:complete len:310 (-) Transcript_37393:188-1117(-)